MFDVLLITVIGLLCVYIWNLRTRLRAKQTQLNAYITLLWERQVLIRYLRAKIKSKPGPQG